MMQQKLHVATICKAMHRSSCHLSEVRPMYSGSSLCRTILARAMGSGQVPVEVNVSVKPFPWPSVKFDPAAIAAAAAFNLLLVFAFLTPTRGAVATIVREKELRLREGMRILGLKVLLGSNCSSWSEWDNPFAARQSRHGEGVLFLHIQKHEFHAKPP